MEEASAAALALPAPTVLVDALPYIDGQYNDPKIKQQVHALIADEMRTFKPDRDYLEQWPAHEPSFESTTLLQSDWMRVCEGVPMPKIDTTRYQLDPPPATAQKKPEAWRGAVDNAKSQLENQATRLVNLELLQQHGAKLWVAQCNNLEASAVQLEKADAALAEQIETLNRKRKAEQLAVAPKLASMQADWVAAVKKNLEIEAQNLKLEAECAELRERVEEAHKRRRSSS